VAVAKTADRQAAAARAVARTVASPAGQRVAASPRFKGRRSRLKRAAERAVGLVLLARLLLVWAVVLVLLGAAGWVGWRDGGDSVLGSRERGTLTVDSCTSQLCLGSFVPDAPDGSSRVLSIGRTALPHGGATGERLAVAIRPGKSEAVRLGWPGLLHAWIPLGGALLLSAVVLRVGLRLRRTAVVSALLGVAVLAGAFVATAT
jgi:hypothetical protein